MCFDASCYVTQTKVHLPHAVQLALLSVLGLLAATSDAAAAFKN
jgi:hypothetical protein